MARFLRDLDELVERSGASEAHEVGCGEGELSIRLARAGLRVRGTDAFAEVIEEARAPRRGGRRRDRLRGDAGRAARARAPTRPSWSSAARCSSTSRTRRRRSRCSPALARPWLIVSVPREPLWRALNLARLSYIGALGNTPGHLGHWSKRGFVRFLGERVEVVEVRSPLPVDDGALPGAPAGLEPGTPRIAAVVSRLRASARSRARPGLAAIVCLGIAWGVVMHTMGWAQLAHFAQVRAFADGQAADRPLALGDQRQGLDRRPLLLGQVARGRRRSTTPLYMAIKALGGRELAPTRRSRTRARPPTRAGPPTSVAPLENYGYDARARTARGGADRGRDADRLGADPARGGDPGGAAAARGPLGRATGSSPATAPRRRSPWASATIADDLRGGVLLARDLGGARRSRPSAC